MINVGSESRNLEVATGSSYGALAKDEHAALAVKAALKKMPPNSVSSVLLFLTSGYTHNPQNAIKMAAKAAATPQVFGCCAMGLLTEQEWLLDVEGAVAMVFNHEHSLQPAQVMLQHDQSPELLLTLTSPNAATFAVNSHDIAQIGAITTDEYGHGPFSIWQSGRVVEREFVHTAFPDSLSNVTRVAEGIRQISPILQVNLAKKHCVSQIDGKPALASLLEHLPKNLHSVGMDQPYNLLCAISENSDQASVQQGHYKLQHIVSIEQAKQQIHLSGSVKAGRHIFWAIRDEQLAQKIMHKKLEQCRDNLPNKPKFALMFPNIGRGAEFYNGKDRDLELFQEIFPDVPMIGFYGNGEIAPGHKFSGLIHRYSTLVSIFG